MALVQMKVLVSSSMKAHFPKKEWTRKASLQPEVVEARQVLVRVQGRLYIVMCICELTRCCDISIVE